MYSELISYRNVPVIAVKEKVSRLIEFKLASGNAAFDAAGKALIYFNISDNAGEGEFRTWEEKRRKCSGCAESSTKSESFEDASSMFQNLIHKFNIYKFISKLNS